MSEVSENLPIACTKVIAEVRRVLSNRQGPIVVALDGGSGAGKSTAAALVAEELDAALIPLDDFFSAGIPDSQWDTFSVEERSNYVFDWNRLRDRAIEPLLAGKSARWRAVDFESGLRADGTYGMQADITEREPADVILIEGAYSASPALADLVDLTILVDVPVDKRHARLGARENREFLEKWHARWDPVERHYFREVRPRSSFDLVLRPE
jgi:uridine kinase